MALPDIRSHHLEVSRTAHYFTLGEPGANVGDCWIVLHGYGQRAADMAAPFRRHLADGRLFVFPEGLSRFYRNHRERTIGASWMTAEDRKAEIRDYVNYLDALHRHLVTEGVPEEARLTVFGFSQGTATATRWLAAGGVRADRLILWGGLPAFELCTERFSSDLPARHVLLVTGTGDEYLSPARLEKTLQVISKGGGPIESIVFDGRHELHEQTLARLFEKDVNVG